MKVYKDENNVNRLDNKDENGNAAVFYYFIDDKRGYWYYIVEQGDDVFIFRRKESDVEKKDERGVKVDLTPDQMEDKIENIVYDYLYAFLE